MQKGTQLEIDKVKNPIVTLRLRERISSDEEQNHGCKWWMVLSFSFSERCDSDSKTPISVWRHVLYWYSTTKRKNKTR